MTRWDDAAFDAYLPTEMVLGEAEVGIIVADRLGNLLYLNRHAAAILGLGTDAVRFAGQPLHALGFISRDDLPKAADMARQVLHGRPWEGTFAGLRAEGGLSFVRTLAVPLRHPGGDVDGMVLLATEGGRRDAHREQDRIGLLERIGERLAGSLELDVTLRHVAELLVPRFADHCLIDLYQGSKLIRKVQTHAGGWEPPPGTWARVGEELHYPPGHFCEQAMSRLETIVVPDLNDAYYPAPSHASMTAADDAGLTSVVAAPLYARGELLGVMNLALSRLTNREEPHYDMSDRDLFGAIASRVAVAIDNAMLFEAERQTALAFQQSLLPHAVPDLDGLEVAFRYVPAKPLATQGQGIQTQVGGDWYDIIPLAAGRVGMVIGDVEGRGARAAATMGQLRAALRAFAQDEKAPADILRKLDEWVRTIGSADGGDPPTASCIYMVYDAWSRELTFAVAGHDAPLLATQKEVEPVEVRHKGVLLGVRGRGIRGLPTYTEQTVKVPPGSTVVLYTDGLTDRRTRADGIGHYTEAEATAMLREAVRGATSGVSSGADASGPGALNLSGGGPAAMWGGDAARVAEAAEFAVPGDIDDDMAILVFQTARDDLASVEHVFPAEPIMVSEARRLAAQTFAEWNMDRDQSELACLLVSEVVTNAVLHASVTPHPRQRYAFDPEPVPDPALAGAARPGGSSGGGLSSSGSHDGGMQSGATPGNGGPPDGGSRSGGGMRGGGSRSSGGRPDDGMPGSGGMSDSGGYPVLGSTPLAAPVPDSFPGSEVPSVLPQTMDRPAPQRATEFALRLRKGASSVWVEVFDPDLRLPRLRTAAATDEGGRGLYLVEQLATRWGSRPTPEGKAVWFEMPLSSR